MDKIKVHAPATVANLSCGFDVLGLCLDQPYDEIEIQKTKKKNVTLRILDSPYSEIPDNPNYNTGGIPAQLIQKDLNLDFGFEIKIKKGIALCGGLGSSAATSAGVVYAINQLLKNQLNRKQMLQYALEGEKISASTPHADNIAPCLLGGLTLIRDTKSLDVLNVPISNYYVALVHPHITIKTEEARNILPENINLKSAVAQWGNVGALILGFMSNDNNLIKKSMEDFIIEPVRSTLIEGFDVIKNNALELGALGSGISGSGPTIFALCTSESIADKILKSSQSYYNSINMQCDIFLSKINTKGPTIL